MRITISDKFLWEVYNFLSESGDILDSSFKYPTMHNCLPGPKNPIFKKYKKERGARKFSKMIYYLKKKGYVRSHNSKNKSALILTKEGISKAFKFSFGLDKKRRKDGRWIMIAFDVPQKNRKARNLLMSVLKNLGYKMFQQSIWITPYDVSEKTEKLLQFYNLDRYAKIFLTEEI